MLHIRVANAVQNEQFGHAAGVLELGRGSPRQNQRFVIKDEFVSRDHVQLEELDDGRIRLKNLSQSLPVRLGNEQTVAMGTSADLELPARLYIGKTVVDIEIGLDDLEGTKREPSANDTDVDRAMLQTVTEPPALAQSSAKKLTSLKSLGSSPPPEKIAYWLESVLGLQRAPAGSKEFYNQTARAVVELVDMELGMLLLHRNNNWQISGYHTTSDTINSRYSRTLLDLVVKERRTFYQDASNMKIQANSLVDIQSVVVSPIFGLRDEVAGILYGARSFSGPGRGSITPLEAQLVQLLAAGVSENLARTEATKTRAQFEQFFSPELVRELERDAKLLEGRNQEVTILVSDLRGFTSLSERQPETTCRVVRDVMEHLTERILQEGGVIVDYAGDGILAMWNAPVPQADHAARACRAALAMLEEIPRLNATWHSQLGMPLALGIGINTGKAQVGNTGSSRRLKYGPHGITVNLASRLQDATKKVGVPLLIADSVKQQLPSSFMTRSVGAVELRGISEPIQLHELCGGMATLHDDTVPPA